MPDNNFLFKLLKFLSVKPTRVSVPDSNVEEVTEELPAAAVPVLVPIPVVSSESADLSSLPKNFDAELYLKYNADLGPGTDPVDHYLNHGYRDTWRIFAYPEIQFSKTRSANPEFETILIVSHAASRSGAPILALNLVEVLATRYNVVVLLLGDGALVEAFQDAAIAIMLNPTFNYNMEYADSTIQYLCKEFSFKFSLVNSVESHVVLELLANNFVPTVSLIHEFASAYADSRKLFSNIGLWSSELVFSANLTWGNAIELCPELSSITAHIIPQGQCVLPDLELSRNQLNIESEQLRKKLRPEGAVDKKFLVVGAGYSNYRKGVDLFIQCAAKVKQSPAGDNFQFVWIGGGYNPNSEDGYSVYIADQIKRSGLHDYVVLLDETAAIETVYQETDLLFVSSRLDPLPNVAIDALSKQVPVICFDKATGIADFLIANDLREYCVADYLDVDDASHKIIALGTSESLYEKVSCRSHEAAASYFDMKKYVEKLEALGCLSSQRIRQQASDVKTIIESDLYCFNNANSENSFGVAETRDVVRYVREWACGINTRKPRLDFDPAAYLDLHGTANSEVDPFADYLRSGRPKGAWDTSN
ncbi:glycosyltransferase [Pseudomonas nunensis]|uniref:glycosyltransferase n=1 Tax=Pseudomonas nunensis TaxID=2961896 RepID=UPI0025B18B40|nr:glycosyltransferase [Pseudomonas nunensis]MDN3220494.1 glycosyltransferase [Pseudomonas nunensis]